ncbi:MAG: hypothetical protein BAJALOKI2v1_70029 [Promethearchaeota archaeon]|nr:MAG: hypothetical protein BAJALOKI2v1_70029 [Candidatus Lokiarchaeota archaeon]
MEYDVHEIYDALLKEGYAEEEIKERVQNKVREFSGFLTNEGAIFLVAKDLGMEPNSPLVDQSHYQLLDYEIDYDEFTIPIGEIEEGMTNILLLGIIYKIFNTHEFKRKDESFGKVGSFLMADPSGLIKIVLWDNAVDIVSKEYFKIGEIIRVVNGFARNGRDNQIEVHLSKKGKVIISPEDVSRKEALELELLKEKFKKEGYSSLKEELPKVNDLIEAETEGFYSEIVGKISKILEFKEFDKRDGTKSFLLRFILIDETSEIPVVIWDMEAVKYLKIIEEGIKVKITDFWLKMNDYTENYEINIGKKSIIFIL